MTDTVVETKNDSENEYESASQTSTAPPAGGLLARAMLVPVAVGLMIGTLFVVVYLAAFHDPHPHHLPVAVVGSAQTVDAVRQASQRSGDAFTVQVLSTRGQAESAVAHRTAFGALVLGSSRPELLVAGANGPSVTSTLQAAFTPVAANAGGALRVTDVAPLVKGDSRGLSVFYAAFGVVLAAFLFGLTSMQTGATLSAGRRLGSAAVFSVLMGLLAACVTRTFNALPANFLLIAVVVGLLALAISAATTTLLRVFGPAGTFVSSVVLLTVGNATSTGILPAQFLPGWLEPLTGVLPVGVAVRALRGAAYFHHDGLVSGLLILLGWTLGSIAVYVAADQRSARHLAHRSHGCHEALEPAH